MCCYVVDKFQWKKAAQYFVQSRNLDRLAECLYRLHTSHTQNTLSFRESIQLFSSLLFKTHADTYVRIQRIASILTHTLPSHTHTHTNTHTHTHTQKHTHTHRLSDFSELAKLARDVADDTPLLAALAIRFEAGALLWCLAMFIIYVYMCVCVCVRCVRMCICVCMCLSERV